MTTKTMTDTTADMRTVTTTEMTTNNDGCVHRHEAGHDDGHDRDCND